MTTRFSRAVCACSFLLAALAACDSAEPRVATTATSDGPSTLLGSANASVPTPPTVRVTDQGGGGLADVLVRWQVAAGSGSVGNDTTRTDADGRASSGGWRLGTRSGPQTLTATISGLAPVVFMATVAPGPPAAMNRRVPEVQATLVGALVAQPPSLTVVDAFENPIPNVSVLFNVGSGQGAIIGPTSRTTDASGVVSLDGWRIGTSTSASHFVLAQVETLQSLLLFRAAPQPDVAVRVEAASPTQQLGVPGVGVVNRPAVRARDQYDNPAAGVSVTFAATPGSGSVIGSTRITTATDGIARVGDWILSSESAQEVLATSPQFPGETFTYRATAVPSVFDIQTVFVNGEPSRRNRESVEAAVRRWKNVIAGEVPPVPVVANANECGPGVPAINETIANVRIFINFDSIDGPRGILGRAGPCYYRTSSGLPVVGYVELDTADLVTLNENGTLDDVMTHEFGHVLGLQRFTWGLRDLVANGGGPDPYYQGAAAREQFTHIGGATYTGIPVPLENTGGSGTRDSHWRLTVLRRELMVGFAQPGGMPLSRLTVGSLSDLGYFVRYDSTEIFTVPSFGSSAFGAMSMPSADTVQYGNDDWPSAIWSIDNAGRRRLARAGDWRVTRGQERRGGGR